MLDKQNEQVNGENELIQEVFANYFGVSDFPVWTLTKEIRVNILRVIRESREKDSTVISDFMPFQEAICYIEKLPELERIWRTLDKYRKNAG